MFRQIRLELLLSVSLYLAMVAILLAIKVYASEDDLGAVNKEVGRQSFWQIPQKGTNQFNRVPKEAWFAAAEKANIRWVRLAFSKWRSEEKDFLIGNADNYQGLVTEDLKKLQEVVGWAEKYHLKVVLVPLSLPGSRWVQRNGGKRDQRLWQDKKWWTQSAQYWRDIAKAFRHNNTVVAYDLINEPTPEVGTGLDEFASIEDYQRWYQHFQGSSHDLPAFYNQVIEAIRTVDKETPVMVESGWYAHAWAYSYWPRLNDHQVLYSVHMYEPFAYTSRYNFVRSRGKGQAMYKYPGWIPVSVDSKKGSVWNKKKLEGFMSPFFSWAKAQNILANQLVISEFGAHRMVPNAHLYLEDTLSVLSKQQVHWAFYSFREDEWDGYDYEMGTRPLNWDYWKAVDKGELPDRPRQQDSKTWKVLEKWLSS